MQEMAIKPPRKSLPANEKIVGRMRELAKPDAKQDDPCKINKDNDPVRYGKRNAHRRQNWRETRRRE
jgi:hypothetical protein